MYCHILIWECQNFILLKDKWETEILIHNASKSLYVRVKSSLVIDDYVELSFYTILSLFQFLSSQTWYSSLYHHGNHHHCQEIRRERYLPIPYYLLLIVFYLLSVTYYLLSVTCYLLPIIYYLSSITFYLLSITYSTLSLITNSTIYQFGYLLIRKKEREKERKKERKKERPKGSHSDRYTDSEN